jgi:chaperonin GroEL
MAASLAPLGALQESGAALLRQAAARTKEEVRDGSTTATVPAHAMLRCAQAVQQLRNTASDELLHGLDTVIEALAAPFQQILANAGIEPKPVQGRVLGGTGAYGFDVAGQRYGDLQAFGVVDATVVTATALRNAASVATLLLSTDAVVSSEELL